MVSGHIHLKNTPEKNTFNKEDNFAENNLYNNLSQNPGSLKTLTSTILKIQKDGLRFFSKFEIWTLKTLLKPSLYHLLSLISWVLI